MTDVTGVLSKLTELGEDARYEAWVSLYRLQDNEQAAFESALKVSPPVVRLLFARFLSQRNDDRALSLLRDLLFDHDALVVDAAKKAFDRNPDPRKWPRLLPVLEAPAAEARYYAMEKLAQGGVAQAITPLVAHLATAPDDEAVRILSALKYLPEKSLAVEIKPYLEHGAEAVRFGAVLVAASLYEHGISGSRDFLLQRLMRDDSPRVRQTAVWALRSRRYWRNADVFLKHSVSDPEALVRQECLLGLASFPSRRVVKHLLKILVTEKHRVVVLKGEAVLLSLPRGKLVRALKTIYRSGDRDLSIKAMLIFAEFEESSRPFFRYLMKGLTRARDERERLPFIEAIGILGRRDAIPMLESFLKVSPLTAYAAMNAILRIWGASSEFPLLRYFGDQELSPLIRQMAIKHFVKSGVAVVSDPKLLGLLVETLKSPHLNLRFLSALALARLPGKLAGVDLLNAFLAESDPSARRMLREGLVRMISEDASLVVVFASGGAAHLEAVAAFLVDAHLERVTFQSCLSSLFRLATNESAVVTAAARSVIVGLLTIEEAAVCAGHAKESVYIAIASFLPDHPGAHIAYSLVGFIAELPSLSTRAREAVIVIMGHSATPAVAAELTSLSLNQEFAAQKPVLRQALLHLAGGAA